MIPSPVHSAGFAQTDITPDYPLRLTPFRSPPMRTGTRGPRPLLAQAAFFGDARGQGCLVLAVDLIGFDAGWVRAIRQKLSEHLELPMEHIIVNASHTHCGPQVRREDRGSFHPCDPVYRESVAQTLFVLGMEAYFQRKPCTASSAVGLNRQPTHRRLWRDGQWFNAPCLDGAPDRDLPLLVCDWPDGRRLIVATLAGHPTTAADSIYDSHYQGATRQRLKQDLGAHVETMILSGASGDSKMTNPTLDGTRWFPSSEDDIRIISLRVTADILHTLTALSPLAPWAFRAVSETIPLPLWTRPFPDLSPEQAAQLLVSPNSAKEWEKSRLPETRHYEISLVSWNDSLRWVVGGGELCSDYGPLLRAVFENGATWVVSYCQNTISYIPTARIAVEGGYEGNRAFTIPNTKDGAAFPPYHPDLERDIVAGAQRLKNSLLST